MSTHLRIPPDVHSVIDADGAVLLDVRAGKYYSLNGFGAEVWTRIEAGSALPDIETEFAAEYGVPLERIRSDVQIFLRSLRRLELIDGGE